MDYTSETYNSQVTSNMSPNRSFSRVGVFAVLLCSCLVGIGVLAMIQSRSQAQPQIAQPDYSPALRSVDQAPSRTRLPPIMPDGQFANVAQPTSFPPVNQQADTRWVREERMEFQTDPTTGAVFSRPVVTVRPVQIQGDELQNNSLQSAEVEVNQLANQYRQASPSYRDSILQAMNKKLSDLFDARQQEQVSRAEKIRAELKETQELLEKRVQLKSKIIERRVKELTGQQDELSWNPQASNTTNAPNYPRSLPPVPSQNPPALTPLPGAILDTYESLPVPRSESPTTVPSPQSSDLTPSNAIYSPVPTPYFTPSTTRPVDENSYLPAPSQMVPTVVPNAVDTPSINFAANQKESLGDSQRSYMAVGFKLKKLFFELEGKKETLGKDHPAFKALGLESAIEDAKSAWDFERQTLKTEHDSIEAELHVVRQQLILANEKKDRLQTRASQGSANVEESSDAERAALATEREMLQLQSKKTSIENAIQWMGKFEEKFLQSLMDKPQPL